MPGQEPVVDPGPADRAMIARVGAAARGTRWPASARGRRRWVAALPVA